MEIHENLRKIFIIGYGCIEAHFFEKGDAPFGKFGVLVDESTEINPGASYELASSPCLIYFLP